MSDLGISSVPNGIQDFATIPDVSVDALATRVNPNQVATGVTRGVQYLGSSNVYSDGGNQQIIVADTVPRVLMGNQSTFGEGFYVSKSGIDVTANKDASQFIFNSNQNTFKIVTKGTVSVTNSAVTDLGVGLWNSGFNRTSQAHNLGYAPQIIAYSSTGGNFYSPLPLQSISVPSSGSFVLINYSIIVDTSNIYLDCTVTALHSAVASSTTNVTYYILQETAN